MSTHKASSSRGGWDKEPSSTSTSPAASSSTSTTASAAYRDRAKERRNESQQQQQQQQHSQQPTKGLDRSLLQKIREQQDDKGRAGDDRDGDGDGDEVNKKQVKTISDIGKSIYNTMMYIDIKKKNTSKANMEAKKVGGLTTEVFLPGRMIYQFDLDPQFSYNIPTTIIMSKDSDSSNTTTKTYTAREKKQKEKLSAGRIDPTIMRKIKRLFGDHHDDDNDDDDDDDHDTLQSSKKSSNATHTNETSTTTTTTYSKYDDNDDSEDIFSDAEDYKPQLNEDDKTKNKKSNDDVESTTTTTTTTTIKRSYFVNSNNGEDNDKDKDNSLFKPLTREEEEEYEKGRKGVERKEEGEEDDDEEGEEQGPSMPSNYQGGYYDDDDQEGEEEGRYGGDDDEDEYQYPDTDQNYKETPIMQPSPPSSDDEMEISESIKRKLEEDDKDKEDIIGYDSFGGFNRKMGERSKDMDLLLSSIKKDEGKKKQRTDGSGSHGRGGGNEKKMKENSKIQKQMAGIDKIMREKADAEGTVHKSILDNTNKKK